MGNEPDTQLGRHLLALLAAIGATSADDDDEDEEEEEQEEEEESEKSKRGDSDEVKRLRTEAKRRRLEARDWKRKYSDLDARFRAIEDKDKTELERSITELDGLKKEVADMKPLLEEAQRELAFFKSGVSAQFQNPAHALRLIDLKDVDLSEMDAEEVASAMKEKAEALLKESPYLKVAAGGSNGGENGENGQGQGGKPDTTGAGQARGKAGKNQPDDNAALLKRFPGLAGRIDAGTQQS